MMKKINKSIILIFLAIVLLILKLVVFDKDALNIILSSAYLGFFLITVINYLRKKETNIEKKYLKVILLLLVVASFVQTGIVLFSGKSIVNNLYYFIVLWMMLNSSSKLLEKKDFNAKKVFIASVILYLVPSVLKFNLELLINVLVSLVIILFFNDTRKNYFGLFDPSLRKLKNDKFKFTQWIKTLLIILVGIIYLLVPILGCILAAILWFFCFGGFFDKMINVYEQQLFGKKLRKSKVYMASMNVYSLAPSKDRVINKLSEKVVKDTINEVGVPHEVYALMELTSKRNYEHIKPLEFKSNEELLVDVEKLFKDRIRPELISKVIVDVFDGKKKNLIKKIEKVTSKFHEDYLEVVNEKKDILEKVDRVNELYNEYQNEIIDIIKSL